MPFQLPQGVSLTWLGHATFLLKTAQGKRVLLDPFLTDNPSTPPDKKDPGPVDLILITHGHSDHVADAVDLAKRTGARMIANPEMTWHFNGKGVAPGQLLEMNKGGTVRLPDLGLSVTMTNAHHSSPIEDGTTITYGGEPAGYVVTLSDGFALYDAGDTCVFSDMGLIAELYRPTLALLPIGDNYTMGPREAAYAARFLSTVQAIIPMHYGTFPALTGTPAALTEELAKLGVEKEVLSLRPGDTLGG